MNEFIFRKYDIRGIVETDFTDDVVINLGKAFGTFVKRSGGKSVGLSGDVRDTTPHLKNMFSNMQYLLKKFFIHYPYKVSLAKT